MNAGARPARRPRTAGFGAVAVAAVLLTSACAAGRVAQTQNQRPSVSGVNAQVGPIAIRNLTVEAPQGASYPKGSALRLIGVFVNNGTSSDVLDNITSTSFSGWGAYTSIAAGDQVVSAGAAPSSAGSSAPAGSHTVSIPADDRTSYGVPDATGSLIASGTKSTIYPGSIVTMTLTFARAGTVTVRVPVNVTTDPSQSVVPQPSGTASD